MIIWDSIRHVVLTWYWLPVGLVYLGIILTILSENRNPSKSLAYIMVLIFLPVLGLVIYYLVGRKPVFKKISFKKKRIQDQQWMRHYYEQLLPVMEDRIEMLTQKLGGLALPFSYLFHQRQTLISTGNTVTLLNNGEEKFPELFRAIENAVSHIYIEYYIFTNDDVGNRVADILIKKWSEGVLVKVVVDDVGSNKFRSIGKRLNRVGIPVMRSLPVTFTSVANGNYRNHRKIVIVDGRIGFIGGINLDARYWNNGKHSLFWRDTAVKVEGNAVKLLEVQFFLSWLFAGGKDDFPRAKQFLSKDENLLNGNATVAIAASGPGSPVPYILETMLIAIHHAMKSVRICTPYFIPNDQLTTALSIAAAKGVLVELILPARSDSHIVRHASYSFIKPLLQRGVHVYLYNKGFMHSKTISVDSRLAFVGTVNMDIRSFYLNFEITTVIFEEEFCSKLENSFDQDRAASSRLTLAQWQGRPALHRGFDSVCRLLTPLL